MWPHSVGKGTADYLEEASSPLARASFQSRLLTFLRPHNLELNLDDSQMQVLFEISDEYRRRGIAIEQMRKDELVLDCVFSASLRNPGTKASSNSGFKDDER